DLGQSKKMLNKLLTDAALRQHGMADPFEQQRNRPLADHLADYRREMEAKGDDPRHVAVVFSRLTALLNGCKFYFHSDLSASRVMDWLAELRSDRRPVPLEAGKEWYRPREAAAVLGIKSASVGVAVRRHRLEARGVGKARRFPRVTVEAL